MATQPSKKATSPSLSSILGKKKDDNKDTSSSSNVGDSSVIDTSDSVTPSNDAFNEADKMMGPDNDNPDVIVDVPDSTDTVDDDVDDSHLGSDNVPYYSDNVTALRANKTPAELAAESPAETAVRYGISTDISDEDADNPRVQAYRDTLVNQVPSGTHLHPDIAKDLQNRGIAEQTTDNAQVKRTVTETYDFAGNADHNDKWDDPNNKS